MTDPIPPGPIPPRPISPRRRWRAPAADVRAAAVVVALLAVLGAVLGLVWWWWSPARPIGFVLAPSAVQPDETEAFVASDGRFAVLTALVGISAGVLAWYARRYRGPLMAVALGAGGLLGALLTEAVGHLVGGGKSTGRTQTIIQHLPLSVHMSGLRLLEAALAVVVYGLFVAFAASDDLDRPEDDPLGPPGSVSGEPGSVGVGGQLQYGGGHGDRPGGLHEPDLAP